jgi:beta-glucanase (GH16 family)
MSLLRLKVNLGLFPKTGKFEKSRQQLVSDYQDYLEYAKSEELSRFEYLSRYLYSAEFEEYKNDPETDPNDVIALKKEFASIKKSKQLKRYLKDKANVSRFTPLTTWKLKFEDDFDAKQLDTEVWLTHYFGGEKILKRSYSLWEDQQCLTEGNNVSLADSKLVIETRPERKDGIAWNPLAGFIPREFPYTSGTVNTSKSFRFTHGKIEAKIKVPKGSAYHAFWLAGEGAVPQINIFSYLKGRFYLGNFWGALDEASGINHDITAITGAFAGESYIFSLEWSKKGLTWAINDVPMKTMSVGLPTEPLYVAFGSGVKNQKRSLNNPVQLEIDWVRYYSK